MKRALTVICLYVVVLLSAILPLQQTAAPTPAPPSSQQIMQPSATPTPTPRPETRALWVKRTTMVSPESVRALVMRAKENGFTDLIVQVRGRGDAYYDSTIEPRAEDLSGQPASFDPLSLTINEAHRYGIKIHAWINIYVVADIDSLPRSKDHLIYKHPEWVMVPRGVATELYSATPDAGSYLDRILEFTRVNRHELEGLFVSPAHPEVKENLIKIWTDIASRYEVDGLHFDYVRYPNPQYDYSHVSIDRFRDEMEKSMADEERELLASQFQSDPLVYVKKFPVAYAQFQRDQVTE